MHQATRQIIRYSWPSKHPSNGGLPRLVSKRKKPSSALLSWTMCHDWFTANLFDRLTDISEIGAPV